MKLKKIISALFVKLRPEAEKFDKIQLNGKNLKTLKKDVIDMREKMRNHLGSDIHNDGSKAFHLKQDTGGIVDIEFMVQYAVLAWSQADPALLTYTDNIRILECLAQSAQEE